MTTLAMPLPRPAATGCLPIPRATPSARSQSRNSPELLAAPAAQTAWEPPVNVFRTDHDLLIVVALPGADADSVSIELLGTGIEIAAFAAPPALPYRADIERLEVPYGRMRRRINLPAGQYTLLERRLANGCLHLRLSEERR